jgi:hypothetical protein
LCEDRNTARCSLETIQNHCLLGAGGYAGKADEEVYLFCLLSFLTLLLMFLELVDSRAKARASCLVLNLFDLA